MASHVVIKVAFRDEALAAILNLADKGALSFMYLHVRLQVLTFGESLPTPRKFAAKGLGTVVEVHVVNETYFAFKNLSTSHLRTLKALLRFAFVLCEKCLRV